MDHQPPWWILPLQVLLPEEYFPPSLHSLCNFKPTKFHLGEDYPCPSKILLPPGDNGESLRAKVTRKVVEVTEKADWERVQNLSYILGFDNGKVEEIMDHLGELQQMREIRSMMTYTSSEH